MLKKISSRNTGRHDCGVAQGILAGTLLVLLFASIACNKSDRVAQTEQSTFEHGPDNEHEDKFATALPDSGDLNESKDSVKFVEQGLDRLSSPFTKQTVIKLNKIVSRSLAAIETFDNLQRLTIADQNTADRLTEYAAASKNARTARIDMLKAATELRASGEKHNSAILAAMMRFVDNVDNEIREETDLLTTNQQVTTSG